MLSTDEQYTNNALGRTIRGERKKYCETKGYNGNREKQNHTQLNAEWGAGGGGERDLVPFLDS